MFKEFVKRAKTQPYAVGAWLIALVATLGSLYFSEIWGLAPCKLCWEQRIFMYPLVFILAVGIWRREKRLEEYVLPLALIGTLIAAYHNILYYQANFLYGVNEFALTSCAGGVSCTNQQIAWFGFVTIPFLSLLAFLMIVGLLWLHRRDQQASFITKMIRRIFNR
jgi:disulfide bond formation protein DsbB